MTGVREQPSAAERQAARTRLYRNGTVARENFPVAEVSECLSEPDATVWLDLYDPTEADLASVGAELGLHAVLDVVADGHLDAAQVLDEELDALESQLFDAPDDTAAYRRAARLRRSLSALRRVALPMRDILSGLLNREQPLIDDRLLPYYRDVQDHVVHAAQWSDSLRDVLTTIRESHLNVQSNQLNQVMKKVTGWAAVIAVPTAITGFYGQNRPYPGSEQTWGFWMSSIAICVLSISLYASFKRRDWI